MEQITGILTKCDKELSKFPILVDLEKKTNIPKVYVCGGVVMSFAILVLFNIWGRLLTNLLGFLYPAYASFKAIESNKKDDDTQWLMYWTVFSFLNLIEFFTEIILYWVPFYFTFKTAFVLYLILPQFKGAAMIYNQFLKPILTKESKKIDSELDKLKNIALEEISQLKKD